MAKSKKKAKTLEVSRFGGTDSLGAVREEGNFDTFHSEMSNQDYSHANVDWDAQSVEAQSKTKLEDDMGEGKAAIVRCFEFSMNPEAFKQYRPTKQELFNSHMKGIEIALWKDGMKVIPEVNPRIVVDEKNMRYRIFVGASPQKGHLLTEKPRTLSDIAHG